MNRCKTCEEYLFFTHDKDNNHVCAPIVEVRCDDYNGDEWSKVHAYGEEEAATKFAERINDEGPVERTIQTKNAEGKVTNWDVGFEYSIDYIAYEQEDK